MRFVVRYWSSLLPSTGELGVSSPHWVDYSFHPASKLGLHNALLVVHDRLEILKAHGGEYECAVFVVDGAKSEKLLPEVANALFPRLPPGEVKWLDIRAFLLPEKPADEAPGEVERLPPVVEQLPLFTHLHTPYDDVDSPPHSLDVEI